MDSRQWHSGGLKNRGHFSVTFLSAICMRGLSISSVKLQARLCWVSAATFWCQGLQKAVLPAAPCHSNTLQPLQQRPVAAWRVGPALRSRGGGQTDRGWAAEVEQSRTECSARCTFPCAASGKEVQKGGKEKGGFSLLLVFFLLLSVINWQ